MMKPFALALALTATPLFAQTVDVETAAGPVAVPANPETVAVFDFSALDTLDALGVAVAGVASPNYLPYVADTAEAAETVGTLFEPDYETVAAGGYDLVIAGGRSAKVVPDLAKIAPTLDMTISTDTLGDGLARLRSYGALFGKQAEAQALEAAFNDTLDRARSAVAGQGGALIVMTNGPKVSAYGTAGRFGWLHTALNLPEAVPAVEQATHGEAISFEFIRDANPDILIVVDRLSAIGREGDSARATLDNALVHETAAWKNGHVIFLDAAPVYVAGGGIQSMTGTLDQITRAFAGS